MQNKNLENPHLNREEPIEGLLLVNKPAGLTSFALVKALRKRLGVKKIGHSGTLDPFATGLMIMLVGRNYTKQSNSFLTQGKEYIAHVCFGTTTDTYDCEGQVTFTSEHLPSREALERALETFQGTIQQIPPMFSAKKQRGKKLYELARQGLEVERSPVSVTLETELIEYTSPIAVLRVACSKGTYIRSIAHDLGVQLGCGAHLKELVRVKSGEFLLENSLDGELLFASDCDIKAHLLKVSKRVFTN